MTRLSEFVNNRSISELYDTYWVPACLDVYAQGLAQLVLPGDRVLDLGCGTGLVTGYAAKAVGSTGQVVGCDPSLELLDAARSKSFSGNPITWVECFAEDLMFDDACFDAVLCHQALQYVANREKTFSEVKRVLKPGGFFHAGVWSLAAEQSAFGFAEESLAKHFGPEKKPIHAWSFGGLPELRRLAEEQYFAVTRLEKLELNAEYESIGQYADVQIACAGRTDENGQTTMGIIDLEDENWLSAIEAFTADASKALSQYQLAGTLVAPFASDEMSARA